jgi:hypothetical protein
LVRLVGFDTPEPESLARCEAERTLAARATSRLRQLVAGGSLDLAIVGRQMGSFTAQPRSAYLLSSASRHGWEHSIPPLKELRYPVTYRSFRGQV